MTSAVDTGRYRLRGDLEGASCEKTDAAADIALSVRDWGRWYMGGGEPWPRLAGGPGDPDQF
jgi:hypothetical protein